MLNPRLSRKSLLSLLIATALCASTAAQAQPIEEVPFITSPDNVTLEMPSSAGIKPGTRILSHDRDMGAAFT